MYLPKILRPFKLFVDLYGTTAYSEIDPSFFVAITYPIIFGLMFGDIGHGLVLIIVGTLLVLLLRKKGESKVYDFCFLIIWLGIAATLGGFLYGEFFGNIYGAIIPPLFVEPLSNLILVLKLCIIVGVIIINLGWLLNMFNFIEKKRTFLAFADPFWKIVLLSGGTYLIFTYKFDIMQWISPPFPILLAVVPAFLMVLSKPFGRSVLHIKYLQKESIGEMISTGIVEAGETYLGIMSNVASYTRILAMAIAHIGLMLIISIMVQIFNSVTWIIPIILIGGNAFVIILEAFLSGIQSLRLQLYRILWKILRWKWDSISICKNIGKIFANYLH